MWYVSDSYMKSGGNMHIDVQNQSKEVNLPQRDFKNEIQSKFALLLIFK